MPNTEQHPRDLAELAAHRRAQEIDPFFNALKCLYAEHKKENIGISTHPSGTRIIEVQTDQGWSVYYSDDDYTE